ncbi:MAG TPA: hypothetical protein DCR35_01065 [Runella sp.]|nr:hypothetical protein [Runella sp.]HAO48001.1 hypothetical protein [Runella sp.]
MTINRIIMGLLVIMTAFGKAAAQPFSLDKNIKPKELKLIDYKKNDSLMNGKISVSKIRHPKQDTAYFFVKGAGIYQTVIVTVANRKSKQKLAVSLCKNNWNTPDRNGVVEDKKNYIEKFKTEGSFGIRVIPKQSNNDYQVIVWVSDEPKKVKMPRAFAVQDKSKTKKTKK